MKIHGVLNVLSSKYAKDLNVSGVSYTYEGFWIKYFIVNIWQGFEYTTVSKQGCKCTRVLNMSWFIKKSYRCLTGFWIFFRFWIYQYFKHVGVTQDSSKELRYKFLAGLRIFLNLWIYTQCLWHSDAIYFSSSDCSALVFLLTDVTNLPWRCTPVKCKARQKPGFPIVTETPSIAGS